MLSFLKKKPEIKRNVITAANEDIVALANAKMIPLEDVKDEVFSKKMMGDGVAFELKEGVIYAPCNGKLEAVFETGHAFGLIMENGVNVLIHIGIDTVKNKGVGFQTLVTQGEYVKAGDALVTVDLKQLRKTYDMTTMLIITDNNGVDVQFHGFGDVTMGQKIN